MYNWQKNTDWCCIIAHMTYYLVSQGAFGVQNFQDLC